jgi:molecular chaperone GrpE
VKKDPAGRGRKDSEAKADEAPSGQKKESEKMKAGTEKGEDKAAEATEAVFAEKEKGGQAGESAAEGLDEGRKEEDPGSEPVQAELSPEEKAEELLKENEELQDKFVRLMADFDNFKKRASKEKSEIIQFGNEGLLKDILPIIDNIERLLTYSHQEASWKSFQEGIELLLAEIGKTLATYGVEPIEAMGKPFDPNLHQAMQRSETEAVAANTIVEVYQKGYLYRGRLLRPSLVVVAVPPKREQEAEGEEEPTESEGVDGGNGQGNDKGEGEEQPIN